MLKWILISIFTINISNTYSQVLDDKAQILKMPCINQKGQMDFACTCRKKKKCLKAMDKSEKKQIVKMNKETKGGYIMKFTKMGIPAYKQFSQITNGKFDIKKFPRKSLEKNIKKLEKVNKKLRKKVEMKYKQMGLKPYKIADRIKARDKKLKKQLGKETMRKIESGQMKINVAQIVEGRGNVPQLASTTIPTVQRKKANIKNIKNQEEKKDQEIKRMLNIQGKRKSRFGEFDENQMIAMSKKKFKFDTIIKDKKRSIFFYISKAYSNQIENLDQDAIKNFYFDDRNIILEDSIDEGINTATNQFLLN